MRIFVAGFLSVISIFGAATRADALILAHWSMDAGAGSTLADVSGNGNSGTIDGGATWVAGRFGSALAFNGSSQWVDFSTSTAIKTLSGAFSVETWIKAGPQSGQALVVDEQHGFIDSTGWALQTSGNSLQFVLGTGTGFQVVSSGDIFDDQWHQVVGTFDGSSINIYVDGVLDNQTAYAGPWVSSGRDLEMGRHRGAGPGRYFDGAIDDTAIWDSALSASDINGLYSRAISSPEPADWALMLIGFGLVGASIRRNRTPAVSDGDRSTARSGARGRLDPLGRTRGGRPPSFRGRPEGSCALNGQSGPDAFMQPGR
jgi:hypothetical protein